MWQIWTYSAVDHCTGRQWTSQTKATSRDNLGKLLRDIYGNGFELLFAVPVNIAI